MKKIGKYFVVLRVANLIKQTDCKGQFTYEHTYTIGFGMEGLFLTNLGDFNLKYVIYDYWHDQFSLYNIDHTPFMINVPLGVSTDSGQSYTIGYITNSLFDCDSSTVEYAMFQGGAQDDKKFWVFRTDGTLLFSKDSVTIPYINGGNNGSVTVRGINNTNAGTKMTLFNHNLEFFIYSLCGTLPASVAEVNHEDDGNQYVNVYPVPSNNKVNFTVIPPDNFEEYLLIISDAQFRTVKTISIRGQREVNLDCNSLIGGNYLYTLQSKNKLVQTGKFFIAK
ncbi:MAG: hypothetical protein ABI763_03920 [Bacteroidota bacterium]